MQGIASDGDDRDRMGENDLSEGISRIGPLSVLPLFMKPAGRKAVVVGTSEAAAWKAELLAAAGAKVVRLSKWTAPDLDDAVIAVADLADGEEARRFVEAARGAGAVVNVIDKPQFSDVQFGTIVNRTPIVIGISTDGAAPMLGQSIRARIESVLPPGLSHWAQAAKVWRPRLKQRIAEFADRRSFWERFVRAAWREPERIPTDADFEEFLKAGAATKGRVIFIAADANDPELLTLKALRALQSATVILHDDEVRGELLELARREARRMRFGGHNGQALELAQAGEIVVRLTATEVRQEVAACKSAGVDVVMMPSSFAGGASA